MELGVDIPRLTQALRMCSPTPANYAQRGRKSSGQSRYPVIIYCAATLLPHDQWFFHNANHDGAWRYAHPPLDRLTAIQVDSHLQVGGR